MNRITQAFLTGSRAYGTPREGSDVDVVVRVSPRQLNQLNQAGVADLVTLFPENDSASIRFGKLNLICLYSDKAFEAWESGTRELLKKAPVTREDAIAHFETLGITRAFDSQGEPPAVVPEAVNTSETPF